VTGESLTFSERFDRIEEKLDRISKAVSLLLAVVAQQPVEIHESFLKELGWERPSSNIVRAVVAP